MPSNLSNEELRIFADQITMDLAPLYPISVNLSYIDNGDVVEYFSGKCAIPMYSYNTPGKAFWSGFIYGLLKRGFTEEQIRDFLISKEIRWLFSQNEEAIADLGYTFSKII